MDAGAGARNTCLSRNYRSTRVQLRAAARTIGRLAVVVPLGLVLACDRGRDVEARVSRASPIIPLDTGTVFIHTGNDTLVVSVEIAETPNQREVGLMEREELPENEGMFFLSYEERDSTDAFWMFRTRVPLDIAYLDRDGRIVATRTMEPCASPYGADCERYPPGVRYWGALEVNGGYLAARGIGVGDLVTLRRGGRTVTPADSG